MAQKVLSSTSSLNLGREGGGGLAGPLEKPCVPGEELRPRSSGEKSPRIPTC